MSLIRADLFDDASTSWNFTRHPGVRWRRLDEGRSEDPRAEGRGENPHPEDAVVVIRMAPGCGYPAHRHVGAEDVVVLRGGYRDEMGEHRAGTFLRYPAGSRHTPVACGDPSLPESEANPACILFAVARGGVENLSS